MIATDTQFTWQCRCGAESPVPQSATLECAACGNRSHNPLFGVDIANIGAPVSGGRSGKCAHIGAVKRLQKCETCRGNVKLKVFSCELFGECSLTKITGIQNCGTCESFCAAESPPPKRVLDLDGRDVWHLFEQTPRVKLPENAAVLTAATPEFWSLVQVLAASVSLSHDVQRICVSLGLTAEQRLRLEELGWRVLDPDPLIVPKYVKYWSSWNRPVFVAQAAQYADNILWIDADAFVIRSLAPIFEHLESGPVYTPDQIAKQRCPKNWQYFLINDERLYEQHPVQQRVTGEHRLNNGIFALRFPRDAALFSSWMDITKVAGKDRQLRSWIRAWDQGCMLHAIESHGFERYITGRTDWNDQLSMRAVRSLTDISKRVRRSASVIYHQAGNEKRMLDSPNDRLADPVATAVPLQMFVLGHKSQQFDSIAKKHYLDFVDLNALNVGEWQHNQLAEFRFYFSNALEKAREEYLGCGSASWNTKYRNHKIDQLWHLELQPKVVWAAAPVSEQWVRISEEQHPGITPLIEELADIGRVRTMLARSLWANNFIAHRSVALDLKEFFRHVFAAFHRRHSPRGVWPDLPFDIGKHDASRKWAYLCERLVMLYFAARPDLDIRAIA